MIILLWFYYSKLYILGSIFITYLLNKLTNKLYYPPLIINMISVILLLISGGNKTEYMYLAYMPVVMSSIVFNLLIYILRKLKKIYV